MTLSTPAFPGQRTPVRITLTVNYATAAELFEVARQQGRSASNLGAYLLEMGLARMAKP